MGVWFKPRSAVGAIRFSLRGLDYEVHEGQALELPAELAWYPAAVGLLLDRCDPPRAEERAEGPAPASLPRRRLPDGIVEGGRTPAPELDEDDVAPAVTAALSRRRR